MQFFKRHLYVANSKFFHGALNTIYRRTKLALCNVPYQCKHQSTEIIDNDMEIESDGYQELSNEYLGISSGGHKCFILQPYIKWGKDKRRNTSPELQLAEAVALVNTLPNWSVVDKMCISLLTLQKKRLLGTGNLEKLRHKIRSNTNITAVFISTNVLKHVQIQELQKVFGVPIYDRYSIVIQIFREHAKTQEAKLQVALAEIPYIWKKMNDTTEYNGRINLLETRKLIIQNKEKYLKQKLQKLKEHRKILRSQRQVREIPSVAVVGYTNAGKTSLIKALTEDGTLQPENKLFATLDTTAHAGLLPCRMKVLYMDTIGFIHDVPETLIEPFVVTLEDAMIADVIVHVYDASHPDVEAQIEHVRQTIEPMISEDKPIIEVANKCDLVAKDEIPSNALTVSSVKLTGIDLLRKQIQEKLLAATGRKVARIRVKSGGTAASWLYKETTVTNAVPDPKDPEFLILDAIVTELDMHKFRRFLKQ